jgi:hypothetical protein
MRDHVRTGDLDCRMHARNHHEAAMKSVRNSDKGLGVLVIVNEREIDESDPAGNVYFLTESILDDCSMRLVG